MPAIDRAHEHGHDLELKPVSEPSCDAKRSPRLLGAVESGDDRAVRARVGAEALVGIRRDDQHRVCRATGQALGDAADECRGKSRVAARTDDDQLGVVRVRGLIETCRRVTQDDLRQRVDVSGGALEQSFAVADGPPAFELSHTSVAIRKRRRIVHGMNQNEPVAEGLGELGSNAHRRARAG